MGTGITENLELFFDDAASARLVRTVLSVTTETDMHRTLATSAEWAVPGSRTFRWSRGMKSLCLALLRLRSSPAGPERRPLLSGGRGSTASTLDSLIYKADDLAWLVDVLGTGPSDFPQKRLLRWFERQNPQINNPARPVRIFARDPAHGLPAAAIGIYIGARPAIPEEEAALTHALAVELGEEAAPATEGLPSIITLGLGYEVARETARPPVGRPSSASM